MVFKPKGFSIFELVPQWFYDANKHKGDVIWYAFDDRALWTLQELRKRYGGPVILNDWKWKGTNNYRGFRPPNPPDDIPEDIKRLVYKHTLSQHFFGRAFDMNFKTVTSEEIRQDISKRPNSPEFQYITCIEADVPHLHFDVRNYIDDILVITP